MRGERRRDGFAGAVRFGLVRDTTPKPPAPGVSNYPLRSGRPGSGNHQPISLSARRWIVIVPGVHCAPIVIGYQRYFCLNCRTFRRSLLWTDDGLRTRKLEDSVLTVVRPHKFGRSYNQNGSLLGRLSLRYLDFFGARIKTSRDNGDPKSSRLFRAFITIIKPTHGYN